MGQHNTEYMCTEKQKQKHRKRSRPRGVGIKATPKDEETGRDMRGFLGLEGLCVRT